jgi:hypothetical protein
MDSKLFTLMKEMGYLCQERNGYATGRLGFDIRQVRWNFYFEHHIQNGSMVQPASYIKGTVRQGGRNVRQTGLLHLFPRLLFLLYVRIEYFHVRRTSHKTYEVEEITEALNDG